jgi:hypothetical protein
VEAQPDASCAACRRRPRSEGGKGDCPKTGVHRDIYVRRGLGNGCESFDARPFTPQAVKIAVAREPQEAALF